MTRLMNYIAALASIISLFLLILPGFLSGKNSTYIQSFAALISVIFLAGLFVYVHNFGPQRTSIVKKEQLVKIAKQHIDSASNKVVLFSNDLSWVNDYAESLRSRVEANCEVLVFHRRSIVQKVIQNANYLREIGAKVYELDADHKLRATLIDPDDPDTARLFIAHKRRKNGSAQVLSPGISGTDRDFEYECAVYQNGADKIIIKGLAHLAANGFQKVPAGQ